MGAMLVLRTLHTKADQHFGAEERSAGDVDWLASERNECSNAVVRQKAPGVHKSMQPMDISSMLSELMLLASTCHVSLQ